MTLGQLLPRITFLLFLIPVVGAAESSSVARMLGVKSAAVANAVEDGARRTPYGEDELTDKMDAEASKFLNRSRVRSPVAYDPTEAAKYQRPGERFEPLIQRTRLQSQQEQALEMLEFRRNVEDAMGKILSFQPIVERVQGEPGWGPEPGPTPSPEDGWDYPSARDPRQRLMAGVESRDSGYANPRREAPSRRTLQAPQYREPALEQTLLYNQRARGTEPQDQRRKIRVINDDSRQSRHSAGGVVRLGR